MSAAAADDSPRQWPEGTAAEHARFLVELYGSRPGSIEIRVPLAVLRELVHGPAQAEPAAVARFRALRAVHAQFPGPRGPRP